MLRMLLPSANALPLRFIFGILQKDLDKKKAGGFVNHRPLLMGA
jgi:hypothetical protein